MIISNVTSYDFHYAFDNMRPEQFSDYALEALYTYLEELSDDTGEPIELDVIAICCEWCEYTTLDEALKEYGLDCFEDLYDNTMVIELANGGVVIQQF